jgi:DNA-binding MarR family transcriptional regulator
MDAARDAGAPGRGPGAPLATEAGPATEAVLAILRTSSWLLAELQPVFSAQGISATRFDALEVIARCGTGVRPAELRDRLHLPAQTVTGVLDQLEAAALVRRAPHPADRRSILVSATDAGRAALDRICPPLTEIEEDCLAALSPAEQQQLAGLLGRIQDRIARRRAARNGS